MTQISSQLSNPLREASDTMCTQRPLFSTTADALKLQAWYNEALWYEPKSCGMNPLWYENVTASHCQITTASKLQMIIFLKHVETDRLFKDPRVKETIWWWCCDGTNRSKWAWTRLGWNWLELTTSFQTSFQGQADTEWSALSHDVLKQPQQMDRHFGSFLHHITEAHSVLSLFEVLQAPSDVSLAAFAGFRLLICTASPTLAMNPSQPGIVPSLSHVRRVFPGFADPSFQPAPAGRWRSQAYP